jgi:hypothetical protein
VVVDPPPVAIQVTLVDNRERLAVIARFETGSTVDVEDASYKNTIRARSV